jgi:hypothetical protein
MSGNRRRGHTATVERPPYADSVSLLAMPGSCWASAGEIKELAIVFLVRPYARETVFC